MKSSQSVYLVISFVVLTLLTFFYIDIYTTRLLLSRQVSSQNDTSQAATSSPFLSLSEPSRSRLFNEFTTQTNSLMLLSSALRSSMQSSTTNSNQSQTVIAPPTTLRTVNNISPNDFQTKILNPDLMKLNLYSPAASNLLLGTAIQESYIGKLSKNIFQISLATAKDINSLYLVKHPDLKNAVNYFYNPSRPLSWNLSNNVNYEVAIASLVYLRSNRPLPNATDPKALGQFWKTNYNTYFGKGTAREYAMNLESFLSKDHQLAVQFSA